MGGLYDKLPPGTLQSVGNVLQGVMVGMDVIFIAEAASAGDREAAVKNAVLAGLATLGLGPGMMAVIGDMVVESARDAGYDFAARQED